MSPKDAPSNPILGGSADSTSSPEADAGQALRKRADALAGELPEKPEVVSPERVRQSLHELQVHQIELEMQNEELRRTQEELEVSLRGISTCMTWRRWAISRSVNKG